MNPNPSSPPPNNKGKRIIKINAISQAKLIKLLLDGDRTCQELADETGLAYVTVLQYTRELHREKAVHICRWDKDARGRDLLKVYKIGHARDARRERLSEAERQQRVRRRRKMAKMLGVLA